MQFRFKLPKGQSETRNSNAQDEYMIEHGSGILLEYNSSCRIHFLLIYSNRYEHRPDRSGKHANDERFVPFIEKIHRLEKHN